MICKICVFCPIEQNFLLVGPYFQHIIFQPQWPLPIALIVSVAVASITFWRWKICLPLFVPCLLWPNDWMDQDTTWYGGMPRPRRHCVRWAPTSPMERGTAAPFSVQFLARVCCGQTAAWIKLPPGTEVGLGPVDIVLDRDPAPPPPKGHSHSQFSAHICCGQMAGWIKMPLGMEVGLSPGHTVLEGDPAPPPQKREHSPPQFRPMSAVAKRLDGSQCHLVWR